MKKIIAALFICCITSAANASVIFGTGFTADETETFEGTPGGRATLSTLFGGNVDVIPGSVSLVSIVQGDWFDFRTSDSIIPNSGTKFGTLRGFGSLTLDFNSLGGISGFSFWASAAGTGNDTVRLFDTSGVLLGQYTENGGFGANGVMEFFTVTSSTLIGSVLLDGRETAFDDIAYSMAKAPEPVPAPTSLAILGLGIVGLVLRRKVRK